MIGSLRICATPETMVGRGESPSPSKGDRRIPFISVGDGRGDDWPQQVSISKEAQEFIAQIEGPRLRSGVYGFERSRQGEQRGRGGVRVFSARSRCLCVAACGLPIPC